MTLQRHTDVELIASRVLHQGPIFDIVQEELCLPSGLRQRAEVVVHPGAVAVAALGADGRLLLVRQYRHALGRWLVELPAGRLEPRELPLEAARRELEEETGYRAARWSELRTLIPAPGFCTERIHLFLAEDLTEVAGGGLAADEDEELDTLWMSPEEVLADLDDGKTLTAAALLLARARG